MWASPYIHPVVWQALSLDQLLSLLPASPTIKGTEMETSILRKYYLSLQDHGYLNIGEISLSLFACDLDGLELE